MERHLSNMSLPENNKMHEKWIDNIENKHAMYLHYIYTKQIHLLL